MSAVRSLPGVNRTWHAQSNLVEIDPTETLAHEWVTRSNSGVTATPKRPRKQLSSPDQPVQTLAGKRVICSNDGPVERGWRDGGSSNVAGPATPGTPPTLHLVKRLRYPALSGEFAPVFPQRHRGPSTSVENAVGNGRDEDLRWQSRPRRNCL